MRGWIESALWALGFLVLYFGGMAVITQVPGGRMGDCDIWAKERNCVCDKELSDG